MLIKTALKRGCMSFFIGVALSQLTNVIISLGVGNGGYISVMPRFAAMFPNETIAVIAQALLTGLLSVVFAMSSVFFMIDRWSFLKQCLCHMAVTAIVWITVVAIVWTPEEKMGLIITPIVFILTYAIVWVTQIVMNRRFVKRMNERLAEEEKNK